LRWRSAANRSSAAPAPGDRRDRADDPGPIDRLRARADFVEENLRMRRGQLHQARVGVVLDRAGMSAGGSKKGAQSDIRPLAVVRRFEARSAARNAPTLAGPRAQ
jgi:hypothetical protein